MSNPFDDECNPWPSLRSDTGKALAQLLYAQEFPAEHIALLFKRSEEDVLKTLSVYTDEPQRAGREGRSSYAAGAMPDYEDI